MRLLTTAERSLRPGAPLGGVTPRVLQLAFFVAVVAAYLAAIAWLGGLSFDPVKDEEQFWLQVQSFASSWPPSLEELRSYREPMTPVSFLLWAGLERLHGEGLAGARLATLAASIGVLALIALQRPPAGVRPEMPVLAAGGLMLYPYWLPTSLLVYTDVPACLFVVCGLFFYVRDRHVASACFFAVAIATRQYTVTFPAAIFAYETVVALRSGPALRAAWPRWLPYLLSAGSLAGWVAFFGGLSPAPSLERWPRHASALESIQLSYALYAMAAIGAYFVVLEFVLGRRWQRLGPRLDRPTAGALVVAVLLFAIFTPYYPQQIGLLNRGLHFLFGDGGVAQVIRVALLLALVCATTARFSHPGLGTWVVAANVAIMPFVWSPWEKYYMPTLAALWFLAAAGALETPSLHAEEEPPAPALRSASGA